MKRYRDKDWLKRKEMKELLEYLYLGGKLSLGEIAGQSGVHPETVRKWLVKLNIPRRTISETRKGIKFTKEHRKNLSKALTGENNPNFGKKLSREARQKLSQGYTKWLKDNPGFFKGEKNPMFGVHRFGEDAPRFFHGMSNLKIFKTWLSMHERCYYPGYHGYEYYHGKGIVVCPEWRDKDTGVLAFVQWAYANGYEECNGLVIHRKDDNENYSPENCIFLKKTEHTRLHNNLKKNKCSFIISNRIETLTL